MSAINDCNAKSEYVELHKWQIAGADSHPEPANWKHCLEPEPHTVPCLVYSLNGRFCAVVAGMDDELENEDCAKEIVRLAAVNAELLKALESIAAAAQSYMNYHAEKFYSDLRIKPTGLTPEIGRAMAAIAKAKGAVQP
jgi:hypothetical protein